MEKEIERIEDEIEDLRQEIAELEQEIDNLERGLCDGQDFFSFSDLQPIDILT